MYASTMAQTIAVFFLLNRKNYYIISWIICLLKIPHSIQIESTQRDGNANKLPRYQELGAKYLMSEVKMQIESRKLCQEKRKLNDTTCVVLCTQYSPFC